MKTLKTIMSIIATIILASCSSLQAPVIVRKAPIDGYKYVFITPTKEVVISQGGVYGGEFGVYGNTRSEKFSPSDIISGELMKKGFILLPELNSEFNEKTLIVNYGKSSTDVTIQFVSADSHELVCSCTAAGEGLTEVDCIKSAITRAFSELFKDKK